MRNHAEKEQRIQDALAGIKDGKYTSFQAAARDLQVKKPTTDLSTEECNARQVLTSLVHLTAIWISNGTCDFAKQIQ